MTSERVYMRDMRAAKMCSQGVRSWFKTQGFDWTDFLKNGIEAEKLLSTNDAMAMKVVEVSRGRK